MDSPNNQSQGANFQKSDFVPSWKNPDSKLTKETIGLQQTSSQKPFTEVYEERGIFLLTMLVAYSLFGMYGVFRTFTSFTISQVLVGLLYYPSIFGMWFWKRWAVYLFLALEGVSLLIYIYAYAFSRFSSFFPIEQWFFLILRISAYITLIIAVRRKWILFH